MLKTAFKVIISTVMPEQLGYLCYIMQFEEKASKRDLSYMKKLSRQEIIHYAKEKGFSPLDIWYAQLEFDKKEQEFIRRSNSKWQSILIKSQEVVKTLLRCRHEIFQMSLILDDCGMEILKNIRPESSAVFHQNLYRDLSISKISIFDIYNIKRKKFTFEKNIENEVYALTDSEEE